MFKFYWSIRSRRGDTSIPTTPPLTRLCTHPILLFRRPAIAQGCVDAGQVIRFSRCHHRTLRRRIVVVDEGSRSCNRSPSLHKQWRATNMRNGMHIRVWWRGVNKTPPRSTGLVEPLVTEPAPPPHVRQHALARQQRLQRRHDVSTLLGLLSHALARQQRLRKRAQSSQQTALPAKQQERQNRQGVCRCN